MVEDLSDVEIFQDFVANLQLTIYFVISYRNLIFFFKKIGNFFRNFFESANLFNNFLIDYLNYNVCQQFVDFFLNAMYVNNLLRNIFKNAFFSTICWKICGWHLCALAHPAIVRVLSNYSSGTKLKKSVDCQIFIIHKLIDCKMNSSAAVCSPKSFA